jgi:hypothetical protein
MRKESTIWDVIEALPPELQKEVEDFARFLLEKRGRKTAKKPLFPGQEHSGSYATSILRWLYSMP